MRRQERINLLFAFVFVLALFVGSWLGGDSENALVPYAGIEFRPAPPPAALIHKTTKHAATQYIRFGDLATEHFEDHLVIVGPDDFKAFRQLFGDNTEEFPSVDDLNNWKIEHDGAGLEDCMFLHGGEYQRDCALLQGLI